MVSLSATRISQASGMNQPKHHKEYPNEDTLPPEFEGKLNGMISVDRGDVSTIQLKLVFEKQ